MMLLVVMVVIGKAVLGLHFIFIWELKVDEQFQNKSQLSKRYGCAGLVHANVFIWTLLVCE